MSITNNPSTEPDGAEGTEEPFDFTDTESARSAAEPATRTGKKAKAPREPKPPKAPREPKATKTAKPAKTKAAKTAKTKSVSPGSAAWPGPGKPSAVLVPRFVRERRAAAATMRSTVFGLLVLGLILVSALSFVFLRAQGAESDKILAETAAQGAQKNVDALQPVADYYDGLVSRQTSAVDALKGDLDNSRLLDTVLEIASATNATVTAYSASTASTVCQGPNPFTTPASMGCLQIGVTVDGNAAGASFVDALNEREDLFNSAFATGFTKANGPTDLQVTVNYDTDALSLRYVPKAQRDQVRADALAAATQATAAAAGTTATGAPTTPTTTTPVTPTPVTPAG